MHAIEHTYVSLLADVARLTGFSEIRGSYEGLQWCLHVAPKLEKVILESVESGVKPCIDSFPGWLRRLALGSLEDPILMRYLRQLLLFCYKAEVTHDIKTTEKAIKAFLDTNSAVQCSGASLARESPTALDRARRHCQSVLYRCHPESLRPGHGPGAVTTSKEKWMKCFSTIERLFPYSDWFNLQGDNSCEELSNWDVMEHRDDIEAKLIAVPKDSRGPRLICVHPAEAIWIQQGLRLELEKAIASHRSAKGPWPRGHVFFDDQSVNGKIALLSSRSRRYATLDMKEASDRISEPLVQFLFGEKYKWFGCCRAHKYLIPRVAGFANVRGKIGSYAPMGNATTFPVQSLVFWAICVAILQRQGFRQPGAVFVFGDDIIVPSECAESIINGLEAFGLLVNRTKSFWRGAFRESCGVDAFNGVNVTPVRWKTTIDAKHPKGLLALSDMAMRLRIAGYEEAAATAYQTLHGIMWRRYGVLVSLTRNKNHGGVAEYMDWPVGEWRSAEWHSDYHLWVSCVWRFEDVPPLRHSHGWNHVLESVCSLERTGRSSTPSRLLSRGARLVRGWIEVG